ncbi:MAG: YceI family protein [Candidatus Korobacteraceae bacterium]
MRHLRSLLLVALLSAAPEVRAQQQVFHLDRSQSSVEFTLADVLHTVHGTFRMKSGDLELNPANGKASGTLIVDATSGDTGNQSRDHKMHKEILESAKYPEIRFTIQTIHGSLPTDGISQLELSGVMTLHGSDHAFTVTAPVRVSNGRAAADVPFVVPYVQWGLKNPSTFLLRVSDKVDIVVHAVGSLSPAVKQ